MMFAHMHISILFETFPYLKALIIATKKPVLYNLSGLEQDLVIQRCTVSKVNKV